MISQRRRPHCTVPPPLPDGRRGIDVMDLQVLLRDADLYPHDIDGYYGNYQRVAVYELQARLFVPAHGHWDQVTVDAVNALLDENGCVDSEVLCGKKPPPWIESENSLSTTPTQESSAGE